MPKNQGTSQGMGEYLPYPELQVEDEFVIDNNKHNIEYVLDYYDRFRINRVQTAF